MKLDAGDWKVSMQDNSFKVVDVSNKQSIGVVGDVEEGIESDDDKPKPEKDDDATEIDESNVTGWQFGQRIQVFSSLGVGIARCRFLGRLGSLLWLACHSSWELLIFKVLVQNHQSLNRMAFLEALKPDEAYKTKQGIISGLCLALRNLRFFTRLRCSSFERLELRTFLLLW